MRVCVRVCVCVCVCVLRAHASGRRDECDEYAPEPADVHSVPLPLLERCSHALSGVILRLGDAVRVVSPELMRAGVTIAGVIAGRLAPGVLLVSGDGGDGGTLVSLRHVDVVVHGAVVGGGCDERGAVAVRDVCGRHVRLRSRSGGGATWWGGRGRGHAPTLCASFMPRCRTESGVVVACNVSRREVIVVFADGVVTR